MPENFKEGHLAEVFAQMRFNIEGLLLELAQRYPDMPTCPSQSLRAARALEFINRDIQTKGVNPRLFRDKSKIRDFLAIHRTVELLEWHERNGTVEGA